MEAREGEVRSLVFHQQSQRNEVFCPRLHFDAGPSASRF